MKRKQLTKRKFCKKWAKDEWLEVAKKQSGKGFTIHNKTRLILVGIGNYKKKMSIKYYGYTDTDY